MSNKSEDIDIELWSQFMGETLDYEPQWFFVIFVSSMIILFLFGVTGNLLTCVVIYFDKSMHTATNYYLFNLAVSDLIVTFAIWIEIDQHVNNAHQFGQAGCKLYFILIVMLWNNSILTMTVLAIERYIGILHPMFLKSKPVWRRVLKIIVLIWMLAISAAAPEYSYVDLVKTDKSALCFYLPTKFTRVMNGILALITFIVPLMIMIFVYVMIAVRVSKMEKSTRRDQIFNHRDSSSKVNKLIIALTLSFVVCWLPFFILRVIFFACSMKQITRLKWFGIIFKGVTFNSWFGMVLNPVLFSLKSTKFRNALKALWIAKVRKDRNTQPRMPMPTTT